MKTQLFAAVAAAAAAFLISSAAPAAGVLKSGALPAPKVNVALPAAGTMETAVLSGGCFWGVQGVFEHVKGVKKVYSGYSGGAAATAQYETVSTGTTGHAESVQVVFDPSQISYGDILRIFFTVATDPTQVNMQFPDEGPQYRNEIFYATPDQKRVAEAYIAQLNEAHVFRKPIATRVDPLKAFFKAEDYHQDYLTLHPNQPYIATYDIPKVVALRATFPDRYIATPTLVFPSTEAKAKLAKAGKTS